MAELHQVMFYPVGNGDSTQIILHRGRRILFDYCNRKKGEFDDTPEIDLKKQLKDKLAKAGRDYFDVVALRVRTLIPDLKQTILNGAYIYIKPPTPNGLDSASLDYAAKFPTTLRRLRCEEFDRLDQHGYAVAMR